MFTIGPHHRAAFELDARKRAIADAVTKLSRQGYDASYDAVARTVVAKGRGDGPETLLFDDKLALVAHRRPSNRTTRLQITEDGSKLRAISPGGVVSESKLEAGGEILRLRQAGVGEYALRYDAFWRPTTITYPSGAGYIVDWGPDNVPVRLVDRVGAAWTWHRDPDTGQLATIEDPLGRSVRIGMDAAGRTTLTDAAGRVSSVDFGDQRVIVTADDGLRSSFSLTHDGKLEARWGEQEGVRYQFDDGENIVRAENLETNDFIAFERDGAGRVVRESSPQGEIQLGYDEAGRLVSIKGGHATEIAYEYDVDGRVTSVSAWGGYRVAVGWDDDDRLAGTRYPGGVTEVREQHACGRPTRIEIKASNSVPVVRQEYDYDPEERLVVLRETSPVRRERRYGYDAESHIVLEDDLDTNRPLRRWTYDLAGNIVSENAAAFVVAPDDRPVGIAERAIAWNEQGCAIALPSFGSQAAAELQFGASQLLHRVQLASGDAVEFTYDPVARRTGKAHAGQRTRFRWCGHQVLREERTGAAGEAITREWLYLPNSYVPLAMREQGGGREAVYSVHHDARGAVIAMLDSTGTLVWHGHYESFGECRVSVNTLAQPWRLQGQYFDPETGLHYNQARYYSPAMRTFLSRDPRWLEWEATNYSYGRNDPWNRADASGGLAPLLAIGLAGAVGAAIGAATALATGGDPVAGAVGGAIAGGGAAIGVVAGLGAAGLALVGLAATAVSSVVESLINVTRGNDTLCIPCIAKNAFIAVAVDAAMLGFGKFLKKPAANLLRRFVSSPSKPLSRLPRSVQQFLFRRVRVGGIKLRPNWKSAIGTLPANEQRRILKKRTGMIKSVHKRLQRDGVERVEALSQARTIVDSFDWTKPDEIKLGTRRKGTKMNRADGRPPRTSRWLSEDPPPTSSIAIKEQRSLPDSSPATHVSIVELKRNASVVTGPIDGGTWTQPTTGIQGSPRAGGQNQTVVLTGSSGLAIVSSSEL